MMKIAVQKSSTETGPWQALNRATAPSADSSCPEKTSESSKSEILFYSANDSKTRIDVRFEGDTVWLTQTQLVALFESSRSNIVQHINEGRRAERIVKLSGFPTSSTGSS